MRRAEAGGGDGSQAGKQGREGAGHHIPLENRLPPFILRDSQGSNAIPPRKQTGESGNEGERFLSPYILERLEARRKLNKATILKELVGQASSREITTITSLDNLTSFLGTIGENIHKLVLAAEDRAIGDYIKVVPTDEQNKAQIVAQEFGYSVHRTKENQEISISSKPGRIDAEVTTQDNSRGEQPSPHKIALLKIDNLPIGSVGQSQLEVIPTAQEGDNGEKKVYSPWQHPNDPFHLQGYARVVQRFVREYGPFLEQ